MIFLTYIFYLLNLTLFSFFLNLHFWLSKCSFVLWHSVLSVLTLKTEQKSSCGLTCAKNTCKIKDFWSHSLQLAELHYIPIFYLHCCAKGNSCSGFIHILLIFKLKLVHYQKDGYNKHDVITKTNIHSLPQNSLLILKMIRVFINSWSRHKGRQERNNC